MFYKNPHFPKTIFLILCLVLCNTVSKAQHAPFEVTLWPSTPPGNSGLTGPETIDEHGFVHNVTLPSLLVYPAAQEKNTGMAVLIAPVSWPSITKAKRSHNGWPETASPA